MSEQDGREAIARIIDPGAFKSWQGLYDYSIEENGPDFARRCADQFYKAACDDALAKADAIMALGPPSSGKARDPQLAALRPDLAQEVRAALNSGGARQVARPAQRP